MGFFSWKTADTREPIMNVHTDECRTVYMLSPDGKVFEEDKYDGYGIFGGKDAYEYLAEMNGFSLDDYTNEQLRDIGIEIELGDFYFDLDNGNVLIFKNQHKYFDWMQTLEPVNWDKSQQVLNGMSMNKAIKIGRLIKIPAKPFFIKGGKYFPLKFSFNKNADYNRLTASENDPNQGFGI